MVVSKEQATRNIRDGMEKKNPSALLMVTQFGMDAVGERKEIHKETKKMKLSALSGYAPKRDKAATS